MFKCFFCKQSSQPGEHLKLVTTKTKTIQTREGREAVQIAEERARCAACSEKAGVVASWSPLVKQLASTAAVMAGVFYASGVEAS